MEYTPEEPERQLRAADQDTVLRKNRPGHNEAMQIRRIIAHFVHGTLDLLEREEELSALDAALARARAARPGDRRGGPGRHRQDEPARRRAGGGARRRHAHAARPRVRARTRVHRSASCTSSSRRRCSRPQGPRPLVRRRGRPRRARCSRTRARHGESSYARLHGLYWLCANLAAEQPLALCIDDAQWADEPSLNFARLPAAASGGPAGRVADRHPPARRAGVRRPARRSSPTPPRAPCDRRRSASDAVGAWVRARSTPRRRRLLRRLPRDHRRQPVPRPRAAARGHRTSGCGRPTPRPPPSASSARRRSRPSCCSASTACPPRRPRWRAPSRCSARAPGPRSRASSPGSTPRRAEEALDALCRADVLTRDGTTGSASCTRSCAPRSTATSRCATRSDGHARAARLESRARGGRLAHRPQRAPRRRLGGRAAARRRRPRARRSGTRRPPSPSSSGRCRSRRPDRARAVLAELASAEAQSGRPAAVEHFREAIAASGDPHERGQIAIGLARCLKFRGDSPARSKSSATRWPNSTHDPLAEELEVELVGSAYISPRRAGAAAPTRSPASRRPTRRDRGSTACT